MVLVDSDRLIEEGLSVQLYAAKTTMSIVEPDSSGSNVTLATVSGWHVASRTYCTDVAPKMFLSGGGDQDEAPVAHVRSVCSCFKDQVKWSPRVA